MAGNKRPDPITSPLGIASFPYLQRPDNAVWNNGVKVGEDPSKGKYKVTLILDKDDPKAQAFIEDLKVRYEAAVKAELERLTKIAKEDGKKVEVKFDKFFDNDGKFKRAKYPFSTYKEDETKWALNFSMNSQYKNKSGEIVKLFPGLWTADLKKWPASKVIGGGSKIKVSFNPNPYAMAGTGAGLSLQLVAVQVIKCESFGERTAAQAGFKAEEGESPDSDDSADSDTSDNGDPGPSDKDAPPEREF